MFFKDTDENAFNVIDYIRLFKAGGLKLVIRYFFDCHLFDILNSTNTHSRVKINKFPQNITNLQHSVLYMSSWTSVIKKSTNIVLKIMKHNDKNNLTFIDIGCGKGKVLLVWLKYFMLSNSESFNILGIDFNWKLIEICKKNIQNFKHSKCELLTNDVTKIRIEDFLTSSNIIYLYNPFNQIILDKLLKKISKSKKKIWVIYNNPVHSNIFLKNNFIQRHNSESWHPNLNFIIYEKN